MRLGIDLDNTLVCYDELFATLADELGSLAANTPKNKKSIRDALRAAGSEDQWTRMQASAYGLRMGDAKTFPGACEFVQGCRDAGIDWFIISHRSRVPYLGDAVDLHDAARQWLTHSGLVRDGESHRVLLELTADAKLARIRELGCHVFIDDLEELLTRPDFPPNVRRILFDPGQQNCDSAAYERASSWNEVRNLLGF